MAPRVRNPLWGREVWRLRCRGNQPERVILGVLVNNPEVPLLLLFHFFIGRLLPAGERQPAIVRRDGILADLSLPVRNGLRLAAVDRDAPDIGMTCSRGTEVNEAAIRGEGGRG